MKKLILIFALSLLSACATKVVGLKQSTTFTAASLKNHGVALLGVVHIQTPLSEPEKIGLNNELKAQLIQRRPDIDKMIPYGQVKMALGEKKHDKILKDVADLGVLTAENKQQLKNSKLNSRYWAVVIIQGDNTEKDRREQNENSGYLSSGSDNISSITRRRVTALYQIFDLESEDIAWGGLIEKSLDESRNYTKASEPGLVKLVKAFKGKEEKSPDELYPFPEAPPLTKVMSMSFSGFAESLPKIEN